jgi:hypothetical protein
VRRAAPVRLVEPRRAADGVSLLLATAQTGDQDHDQDGKDKNPDGHISIMSVVRSARHVNLGLGQVTRSPWPIPAAAADDGRLDNGVASI